MNHLRRVFISIARNKGRTIAILLLVTILGALAAGAFLVHSAFTHTEEQLRRTLPPVATIDFNPSIMESGESIEPLTIDMIRELGALPYVETFNYALTYYSFVFSEGLLSVPYPEDSWTAIYRQPAIQMVNRVDFADLHQGLIEMVDGRSFEAADMETQTSPVPMLVSDAFTQINHLSIGSMVQLESLIWDENGEIFTRVPYEGQIVGIFRLAREIVANNQEWLNDDRTEYLLNRFYVPSWFSAYVYERQFHYEREVWGEDLEHFVHFRQPVFVLRDATYLSRFEEAARGILPPNERIVYLSNIYEHMTGAMDSLNWLFTSLLVASIGSVVIILSLLVTLFLKERKEEIGIYLALGEKKIKILAQLVTEVFVIGVLGLIVALAIGQLSADAFSEQLLRQEMIRQQDNVTDIDEVCGNAFHCPLNWFSPGNMEAEEMMAHFDLSLSHDTMMMFFLGGFGVLFLSTVAPVLYVLRLSPKEVLLDLKPVGADRGVQRFLAVLDFLFHKIRKPKKFIFPKKAALVGCVLMLGAGGGYFLNRLGFHSVTWEDWAAYLTLGDEPVDFEALGLSRLNVEILDVENGFLSYRLVSPLETRHDDGERFFWTYSYRQSYRLFKEIGSAWYEVFPQESWVEEFFGGRLDKGDMLEVELDLAAIYGGNGLPDGSYKLAKPLWGINDFGERFSSVPAYTMAAFRLGE